MGLTTILPTFCNKYAGDHLALARHEFKVFKGGWWMLIGQLAASSIWSLSYCNICRVANIFFEPRISMTPRREMDYWEFLTQAELNSSGARRLRRKKEVIASIHSKCFEDIAVVFLVWNYQESQWRKQFYWIHWIAPKLVTCCWHVALHSNVSPKDSEPCETWTMWQFMQFRSFLTR